MAIPAHLDLALACTATQRNILNTTFSSLSKILYLHFPSPKPRRLLPPSSTAAASSADCKSPVLENDAPIIPRSDLKSQFDRLLIDSNANDLNSFLCRLFKDPQTEEFAYQCYQNAKQRPDFRPTNSTLSHMIRHLIRTEKWGSVPSVFEDFRSFNVFPKSSACSRFVARCIRSRKFRILDNVLEVFKSDDGEVSVSIFGSAMKGYNKLHMYTSTIDVHKLMQSKGIVMDSSCLCQILEAYLKVGNHERVVKLFEEFESGRTLDSPAPISPQICRILCESMGKLGQSFKALEFFREMTKKGMLPNSLIYSTLIRSFASIREVKIAEDLFQEAMSKKMLRNLELFQKLVLMYLEEGLVEKTLEIISAMKSANVRVSDNIFCAILSGYSKEKGLRAAAKVYEDLISFRYCEPGQVTYASMISIYCRLGLYSQAEAVFQEMEQKGFNRCVVAYSSMIVMYGKTGRLGDAMRLVAKMKERGCQPNVWVYNSLLEMHGKANNLRLVEKLWKEMKRQKVAADKVSYTTIISAYSKANELETCKKLYEEYITSGGELDRAMAGIMVGVFSRTDQVNELVKLLQDMKDGGASFDGRLYSSALRALKDAGMSMQAEWLHENFGGVPPAVELRGRGKPKEGSVRQNKPIGRKVYHWEN